MGLRWVTDEDAEVEFNVAGPADVRRRRRRWWLLLLLLGLLAVGLVYGEQLRQARVEEAALAAEVSAIHGVWHEALVTHDEFLFASLLAGSNQKWRTALNRLFEQDYFFDRPGFALQASAPEIPTPEVTVAPDWQSAVVTHDEIYTVATGPDTTPVILQQTTYYQRTPNRWLVAAPDESFWGEQVAITGTLVALVTPGRDLPFARQLHSDLEQDLEAICAGSENCRDIPPLRITLDKEVTSLVDQAHRATPLFAGQSYRLPAPTLVGLPVDDTGYALLYAAYTGAIRETFRHNMFPPVALPDQEIATLCIPPGERLLKLFRYDLRTDTWQAVMPERTYAELLPSLDDHSVLLREYGDNVRLGNGSLLAWRPGRTRLLLDSPDARIPQILGWAGSEEEGHLLLNAYWVEDGFQALDLGRCNAGGCAVLPLTGFTLWAPGGDYSLVVRQRELALADSAGEIIAGLGSGFSPFWLDDNTFGYLRIESGGNRPVVALVTGHPGSEPQVRWLSSQLPDVGKNRALFLAQATLRPGASGELLLVAPSIGNTDPGNHVFLAHISEDEVRLEPEVRLPDNLRIQTGLFSSSGSAPVAVSADGRWLVASESEADPQPIWRLFVHEIGQDSTQTYQVQQPPYTLSAPLYDWSADSNWLLIVDDDYFRVAAPAFDYERIVPHAFDTCLFSAWVTPAEP